MALRNIGSRAMAVSNYYRMHRLQLIMIMVALIFTVMLAVIGIVRTMPPRIVVMATGPEGGAYHEFGKQYRDILARDGVTLQLLTTAGGTENLAQLKDSRSKVDVAFLNGGITSRKESPHLESLGTVFYEPLWFFYRDIYRGKGVEALKGRKVSIGPVGSGTQELARKLLGKNGIDERFADLLLAALQPFEERGLLTHRHRLTAQF